MKIVCSVVLALVMITSVPARGAAPRSVSEEDLAYLRNIMRDTWHYIGFFVSPTTGLPYDSNEGKDITNTTNVGLYLASICMACKLGYVTEEHAVARITKILDSLDTYGHWGRLYNNWLDPDGKMREAKPGDNNISDYNKLPAGLIVVRQTFPQLAERCTAFLNEIPWGAFQQPGSDQLRYAFDVAARKTLYPVHYFHGEDKMLGHFLMIASEQVAPATWDKHNMATETKHGYEYYQYGWQGGGLFMHFICGLFLDHRGTSLGKSGANFAWAQLVHANKIGAPVWGWSACVGPSGRYLGMGGIVDPVVTPHASALAINLFPHEAIANLKRLEDMGLRDPYMVAGKAEHFGFRDAVNWKTGEITDKYLVLDQAMLFLSLVNFCEDGLLWRTFGADPLVKRGRELIQEYALAGDKAAEQEGYVRSLNFDEPGTFWLARNTDGTYRPGDIITRELWIRSLSSNSLSDSFVEWRVLDHGNKPLHRGQTRIDLPPHETRNLITLSIPTDAAEYGTSWLFWSRTVSAARTLAAHEEKLPFFSYQNLTGTWHIVKGDDEAYARPDCNDSAWLEAIVPLRWEDSVFPEYDGMAWYRLHFSVTSSALALWGGRDLALALGAVDDADVTFLNGEEIGRSGAFPPEKETAYNAPRLYRFNRSLLKDQNVLAVRVSDWGGNGGIWRGPVAIGPVEELQNAIKLLIY